MKRRVGLQTDGEPRTFSENTASYLSFWVNRSVLL